MQDYDVLRPPILDAGKVEAYLSHLGQRGTKNDLQHPGGSVWSMLTIRRTMYEHILQQAEQDLLTEDNVFWQKFLQQEIACIECSEQLSKPLYFTQGHKALRGLRIYSVFDKVVDNPRRGNFSIGRCLSDFLARTSKITRLLSGRMSLQAMRADAIWQWARSATSASGELHFPILFGPDQRSDPRGDRRARDQSHIAFVGLCVRSEEGIANLHIRIDDSWGYQGTSIVEPAWGSGKRRKLSSYELRVQSSSLTFRWMRRAVAPLLEAEQLSWIDFRDKVLSLGESTAFRVLGGSTVPAARQSRPIADQEGRSCTLKNHSRGVAARLEQFMATWQAESSNRTAREKWHFLKAQERAMAAAVLGAQATGARRQPDRGTDDSGGHG